MNDRSPTDASPAQEESSGSPRKLSTLEASTPKDQRALHLSLISHTNVGKTTLARTLLREDVGEVLDQAHVTEISEAYTLIEAETEQGDAKLVLWDTPGFGDTARLMRRLRDLDKPLGWLLSQVWDRIADRGLWSSQQAARNIRDHANAVLYLVNAAEEPAEAGYVRHELDLLTWIGRPVLLLLNQTGAVAPGSEAARRVVEAWKHHVAFWPIVQDVLSLDAFTRCWVQEGILLDRVAQMLPEEEAPVMAQLARAWNERNREIFHRAVDSLTAYLARAAADRAVLDSSRPSRGDKKKAMEALGERLETETQRLMDGLI
ncbi:MAG: GTPase domain-containing protein, partial [Acidobacteriota bacterium]|nr:GTPase domain-containing protein [Acidobacteriota bacterium]